MAPAGPAATLRREFREAPATAGAFGRLLREHRIAAGLTQEALAERAGLSARGSSDLERGLRQVPQRETVRLLADALELAGAERAEFAAVAHRPSAPVVRRVAPAIESPTPFARPLPPLPQPPTPLVGREPELALLGDWLRDPQNRLVTLTGPGGVGKTRLALAVGTELAAAFADGVAWVELGGLGDPDLVPAAVAQVLGVREGAGRSLTAALHERLRDRRLLLVLDNCEHLHAGVRGFLADLLAACPGPTVLATSRARLRLRAERDVPVRPLSLPSREVRGERREDDVRATHASSLPDPSTSRLLDSSAVELFVARAGAVRPGFALTGDNAAAVVESVRLLDGLPLAIELAAARLRVLSPAALLGLLSDRLRVLTGGPDDAPDRQRTMRAAVAWSHDLLGPAEQTLFRRLGVFAGGCDLEAVAAIAGCPTQGVPGVGDPFAALDGLSALADQSLLVGDERPDGAARFRMLETVRAYAVEQLEASGEAEELRRAHAVHYLALAERAMPALQGPDQRAWADRLTLEHDNLRAALAWAIDNDAELALRLTTKLRPFWDYRGVWGEGRAWLARAIDAGAAAPPALRACGLHDSGVLAWRQGEYATARAALEAGLALWQTVGNQRAIANALNMLGLVAVDQGDPGRALPLLQEALELRRACDDRPGVAGALSNLGLVARSQGDLARAAMLFEESLALQRALGDQRCVAVALNNLGSVARHQGDLVRAAALLEEALALRRSLGDQIGVAASLYYLGAVAQDQGGLDRAAALYEESLAILRVLGDQHGVAIRLNALGDVALAQGHLARAAALNREALALKQQAGDREGIAASLESNAAVSLAGGQPAHGVRLSAAAAALREALGTPLRPREREAHQRDLAELRQRLGDAAFAAAWEAGRALPLTEAVAEALAAAESGAASAPVVDPVSRVG